jgi:hypothetical protein
MLQKLLRDEYYGATLLKITQILFQPWVSEGFVNQAPNTVSVSVFQTVLPTLCKYNLYQLFCQYTPVFHAILRLT